MASTTVAEPTHDFDRGTVLRRPTEMPRTEQRRRVSNPLFAPEGPSGPSPGDIHCPQCTQFNAPTRVFCRRCGYRLAQIEEAEPTYSPIGWWRRHTRRDVKVANAGARPGHWGRAASGGGASGRRMAIMARVGSIVIGIAILLSFVGPVAQPLKDWYRNTYKSIMHKVNVTYTQQFAIGANATTSDPAHPAGLAVDDAENTYWQSKPNAKKNGVGQVLTIVFAQPTTIDRIGLLSGAGPSQQTFLQEARPKEILFTLNGHTVKKHVQNSIKFQNFDVHATNLNSMTVKILSVYPSAVGHAVAITEIEFFQRT